VTPSAGVAAGATSCFFRGAVSLAPYWWAMKSRPKLSGAPLAYTVALVEGTADSYQAFGKALWSEDRAVPPILKELVFIRTSILNQCPT